MALKIEKALKSRAGFWLDLQQEYDFWHARQCVKRDNVEVINWQAV